MIYKGNLRKMKVELGNPIQYTMKLGEKILAMNDFIAKKISIKHLGQIHCISCGKVTSKSFAQGYCFPCFKNGPENAECVIRPEMCEGHLGKGRDLNWENQNHVQPHVVYLAVSSGLKVGVTRQTQIPTRWIDQGAWKIILLAETPYRQMAGEIEVELKEYISDKTNWQRMLKNELAEDLDIIDEKYDLVERLPEIYQEYVSENDEITILNFPVNQYPVKVKSINLDKLPEFENTLVGIKGQYLIFEDGQVMNIRKHGGYEVEIKILD